MNFIKKFIRRSVKKVDPGLRGYIETVAFFAFLVIWIALLFIITPKELVTAIGIDGGYALVFFTAIIAASAFTSVPFYTLLFSLASTGKFNPIILGIVAAPGLLIGDYLLFYLGLKSRSFLAKRFVKPFSEWIERRPKWAIPFVAFVYTLIAPLPQDILMLALGLGDVPYKRVFAPLLLGNATSIALIAYFISRGMAY